MTYAAVALDRQHGTWRLGVSFSCVPNRVVANSSPGRITGAKPSPTSDRVLLISAQPLGPCGTSPTAAQFHVRYAPTRVSISATYPRPPADEPYTCPLMITPPFALQLNEPISNREIYDDGFLRPQLVTHKPVTRRPGDTPIPKTPVS
jgi:hypothetical protein